MLAFFNRVRARVLLVCAENICRSVMAEAILKAHLQAAGLKRSVRVSSAGVSVSQPGRRADQRALRALVTAGLAVGRHRSAQIRPTDIDRADHVLAMEGDQLEKLRRICPAGQQHKIALLMDFAPAELPREIRDPYFGPAEGFTDSMELMAAAAAGLTAFLQEQIDPTD